MRQRSVLVGTGCLATLLVVTLALLWSTPSVGAAEPLGGNNGTVKIHDGTAGTTPIVRNEPHVCTFHLHFVFADPTQSGSWQIRAWAPGDMGAVVLSGGYDTASDGADREPATGVYSLPNGHYKLFWIGRSEKNLKHKTFWVDCSVAPSAPSASPTPASPTPGASPTPASPTPGASPTGGVSPASATPAVSPSGQELSAVGSPPITLPPTDAIPVGATSGVDSGAALVLAGLLGAILVLAPSSARRAARRATRRAAAGRRSDCRTSATSSR